MKMNERLYNECTTEPFLVQDLKNDIKCEFHVFNQHPEYVRYTMQDKLAVWSTLDGKTYRFFIEKGYYEKLKELYTSRTNDAWMDYFEKEVELINKSRMYSLFPSLIIILTSTTLGLLIPALEYASFIGLGIAIIIMCISKRILTRKSSTLQYEAINKIKKVLGTKRFEELLMEQEAYKKDFYTIKEEDSDTNPEQTINEENIDKEESTEE